MATETIIAVRFPKGDVEKIDALVANEDVMSRSDFIRASVRAQIDRMARKEATA